MCNQKYNKNSLIDITDNSKTNVYIIAWVRVKWQHIWIRISASSRAER